MDNETKSADWNSPKSFLEREQAKNEAMREFDEAAALAHAKRWTIWHLLLGLLLLLAAYFLASAFFDRANFRKGASILKHNALQIPGAVLFLLFTRYLLNRSRRLREASGPQPPEEAGPKIGS